MKKSFILTFLIALSFLCFACEEETIEIVGKKGTPKPVQKPVESEKNLENNAVEKDENKLPLDDIEVSKQDIEDLQKQLIRLNTSDSNVINEVTKYVQNLKKVGLKALIDIINDKESEFRLYAANIMSVVRDRSCMPYLEKIVIENEEDEHVLDNVMMGLGSYGRFDKIYEQLLVSESAKTRKCIAILLRKIRNKFATEYLIKALKDKNPEVRYEVIVTLGDNKEPGTIEPLVYSMRNDEVEENRDAALEAIIRLNNKEYTKYMVEFFQNKQNNYEIRSKAIEAIARLDDDSHIDEMIPELEDENWEIRRQTIVSLSILRAKKSLEKMISMYQNDKIEDVRFQAFVSMGTFKDDRVKKILIDNIKNTNIDYAVYAIMGLRVQGDPDVIPLMFERINDENPEIRFNIYATYYGICIDLKIKKYIDVIKEREKKEKDEELKNILKQIVEFLERELQTKPQTQESSDDKPNESKESDTDSTDK